MIAIRFFIFLTAGILSVSSRAADASVSPRSVEETYRARVEASTSDLNRLRAQISAERTPLLDALRKTELQIVRLEAEMDNGKTEKTRLADLKREGQIESEALRKNLTYLTNLADEQLKALAARPLPGDDSLQAERVEALRAPLIGGSVAAAPEAVSQTARLLLNRVKNDLGGRLLVGRSVSDSDPTVRDGTFAFIGPAVYFRSDDGKLGGVVRQRDGSPLATTYALPEWPTEAAAKVFAGQGGALPMDASDGKALHLRQTTGTFWEHVKRGGTIAFVILGLGALCLILIAIKVRDLRRLQVDLPSRFNPTLHAWASGNLSAAEKNAESLRSSTRNLALTALAHAGSAQDLLENRLTATLTEVRQQAEKRLPLLAVIATASPLTGLLGTVMGMVKTFSLITVFGTGNATKLSSGISEVLVTTELGLAVAIPALIAHGILSQQINKRIGLLERYAFELTLASEAARRSATELTESTSPSAS